MDWFGQPTQGGFWEAEAENLGAQYNIKLDVEQGGPQVQGIPQVAAGQVQFGWGGEDSVMLDRAHGAPVLAVSAPFANLPQCLIYHSGQGIKKIQNISGHQVAVSLGSAYWKWLVAYYHLKNIQAVPDTGSLTQFQGNQSLIYQCFITDEPYQAQQLGIKYGVFWLPNLGFNPYYVLFSNQDTVQNNPTLVADVVAIVKQGWLDYLKNPTGIEAEIAKMNPEYANKGHYNYTVKTIGKLLVASDKSQIGCMTPARIQTLKNELVQAGMISASFNWKSAVSFYFQTGCKVS
jgi:NitT/TauT family transport system substrate-binding protein